MTPEDRKLMQQLRDAAVDLTEAYNEWYGVYLGKKTNENPYKEFIAAADVALSQPASEDAWLRKSLQLTAKIRDATDDESSAAYFDLLEHHLRARLAPEGFESVKEPAIKLAAELLEKKFVNLGNFSGTKEVWANKIRGWLFIRGPVEDALRKAMIEAAKESGK